MASSRKPSNTYFPDLTVDLPPVTPNAADDEFTEAALDTGGTRFQGATAWAWRNQGSATAVMSNGSCVLTAPASASDNIRIIEQSVSGSWKYRTKISSCLWALTDGASCGIILVNSSNNKNIIYALNTNGLWNIGAFYFSNLTTYGGFSVGFASNPYFDLTNGTPVVNFPHYLEVESNGTTLTFRYSTSGVDGTFFTLGTETIATHVGTVDKLGLYVNTSNSSACIASFDWFRRAA